MSDRLVLTSEEVVGMLRQGAKAAVYLKSIEGHVHGKRIRLKSVTIEYDLVDVKTSWGSTGILGALPANPLTDPPLTKDKDRGD